MARYHRRGTQTEKLVRRADYGKTGQTDKGNPFLQRKEPSDAQRSLGLCTGLQFCAKYGITITAEQWPSAGLPGEIITDRGREFGGARIDAMCARYGIERQSLPPFRPDQKGLVEKSFDLIQNSYTSALRGKGVIEPDAQERWAVDYRKQAVLTLNDYIKLLIHTIIYLNSARVLRSYPLTDEMLRDHVTPTASGLWRWFAERGRSSLLELEPQEYELLALSQGEATVDRHGVRFRGFHYGAKEHRSLLEKLLRKKVTVSPPNRVGCPPAHW